jgi:hypothetical protein
MFVRTSANDQDNLVVTTKANENHPQSLLEAPAAYSANTLKMRNPGLPAPGFRHICNAPLLYRPA